VKQPATAQEPNFKDSEIFFWTICDQDVISDVVPMSNNVVVPMSNRLVHVVLLISANSNQEGITSDLLIVWLNASRMD
jgi:hypothetical protein